MEEAEALSDRIAIMVSGRIRSIGTSSHIRNKFGQCYELEIKIKIPKIEKIQAMSSKLDLELKNEQRIKKDKINRCLEILDAEDLTDEFDNKNLGLSMQLKSEGSVSRDLFISWVITENRGKSILKLLRNEYKTVEIVEHYLSSFKYRVAKQDDKSLGFLFSLVENSKKSHKIAEYAISQTTLDQIFTDLSNTYN